MKTKLLNVLIAVILFLIPNVNFGQAPTLGTTANFALFTAAGALTNGGTSFITGDIGSFDTSPVGFPGSGSVVGTIYTIGDPALTQAAADVGVAYGSFSVGGTVLGTLLETQTLTPGEYYTVGAASLNGVLTLDGGVTPDPLFIIKINGALSVGTTLASNITLLGTATLCNVYWQVNGDFTLVNSSIFKGTVVSNGAISLSGSSTLLGRGITTAGAINTADITVTIPTGCGDVGIPVFILGASSTRCQGAGTVNYEATAANTTGITYTLDATTLAFAGNSIVAATGAVTYAAGWSGTSIITASAAGTNGPTTATHTVTITANNTATLTSIAGTDAQTTCISTAITEIAYSTIGATSATFSGLPAGVTGVWSADVITINGTPTESGTFSYTVTLTGGCGSTTATGSITVAANNTATLTSASGTNAQSVSISTAITDITYTTTGATGATFSGLPTGVTGTWLANVVTISGTPTESGTYSYTVTLTGGCGSITATGSIIVTVDNTVILNSAVGTDAQTVSVGTAITDITYTTTGATGATFSGLPAGVTGSWLANVVTISGTPTESGTFTYTVTLTGGTGTVTTTGTITVIPNNTATLSSGVDTDAQIVCINTPILNITYTTTGATGATFSGLPAGVTGSWLADVVTISGTPTVSGTFNYTITLTGGVGTVTAIGTITVTANMTVIFTSAVGTDAQTTCIGTAITDITYATSGATGATFSGLPTGVSGAWLANVVTISGTPTESGIFNYTVTLTGSCGSKIATGSIIVNPSTGATIFTLGATTVCQNAIDETYTATAAHSTSITYSVLPLTAGVINATTGVMNWDAAFSGIATITATSTGLCGTTNADRVVTINPFPIASVITAGSVTTFCEGNSVVLSGNVDGTWSTGAATPTITVSIVGDYFVTNANGCGSVESNHIIVTVNPLPIASVITASGAVTFCEGEDVILSGNIGGTWSTGAITPTITVTATGDYFVTNTNGCGNITSNHIVVTVNPLPIASVITASGAITFCEGENVILSGNIDGTWSTGAATPTLTVTTSGEYFVTNTNGCGNITSNHIVVSINPLPIASIISASGAVTFCEGENVILSGNIGGVWSNEEITSSITVNSSGDYFVTSTNGCGSVISNHIIITVNPLPFAITGIDVNICSGNSIELGTSTIIGHTYLWTPATELNNTIISNPIASPTVTTTYTLTETVTATGCQMSNSVIVTVNPLPIASVISAGGATTFCANESVVLSGNVDGVWSNGLTTPFITVNTPGDYFVTNANGCGSLTSNHILVTVNPLPEAITGIDANICIGNIVTLGTASASGHTYIWSPITGLSSSTISNPVALTSVTTTYTLTETITATGCQNSNSVTVLVNTNPSITLQPNNETICLGSSAHFTVDVTGTGLTYQWRNGVVNLTDGGNISGATTATLTINPVNVSDAALNYNVVVTGTCSLKETSINVSLAVNTAPSITIEPVNQTVCEIGGSASFWVDATGSGLSYQWKRGESDLTDGGNISGANTAMLTISPVELEDVASDYNVVVTGTCSSAITSLDASLSICNTTSIASPDNMNNVVSFFPNPFMTSINIIINETSQIKSCELRIYNILGEKVFDTTVTKQVTTLETGNIPSGTYIYRVISNSKIIQSGKLINQK